MYVTLKNAEKKLTPLALFYSAARGGPALKFDAGRFRSKSVTASLATKAAISLFA
jgi:hypothetical protein